MRCASPLLYLSKGKFSVLLTRNSWASVTKLRDRRNCISSSLLFSWTLWKSMYEKNWGLSRPTMLWMSGAYQSACSKTNLSVAGLIIADCRGGSQVLFMNSDGYLFTFKWCKTPHFSFYLLLILDTRSYWRFDASLLSRVALHYVSQIQVFFFFAFRWPSTSILPLGHTQHKWQNPNLLKQVENTKFL